MVDVIFAVLIYGFGAVIIVGSFGPIFKIVTHNDEVALSKLMQIALILQLAPLAVMIAGYLFFDTWSKPTSDLILYTTFIFFWIILVNKHLGVLWAKSLLLLILYMLIVAGITAASRSYYRPFSLPETSMEDTIVPGDFFITNSNYGCRNYFFDFIREFRPMTPPRGNVLIFSNPKGQNDLWVKRCVALSGDVVMIKNKDLYLNGEKQVEPYVKHIDAKTYPRSEKSMGNRDNYGPVTIEPGKIFVLGDNRDNSLDSMWWGPIDTKLVKYKACFVYWRGKEMRPMIKVIK